MTWYRNSVKLFETDRVLMTTKSAVSWSLKLRRVSPEMFGKVVMPVMPGGKAKANKNHNILANRV